MIREAAIIQCDMCGKISLAKPVGSQYNETVYGMPDGWKRSQYNDKVHFCPECAFSDDACGIARRAMERKTSSIEDGSVTARMGRNAKKLKSCQ